eukprot:scaffold173991_cov22-Tisochrysis_lutea.AAC.1
MTIASASNRLESGASGGYLPFSTSGMFMFGFDEVQETVNGHPILSNRLWSEAFNDCHAHRTLSAKSIWWPGRVVLLFKPTCV